MRALIVICALAGACKAATPVSTPAPSTPPASTPAASTPTASTPPASTPAPAASQPAPAPNDLDGWLERIEARGGEIRTLRAKLRYDRVQGLLGDEQRRLGTLVYEAGPPPRFALHVDRLIVDNAARPQDRRYTFDGHWLAERNADERIFLRYELVPADREGADLLQLGQGPFALPLNMNKRSLLERFEVTMDGETDESLLHLVLLPREGVKIEHTRIDLWYDRDTLLPVRCETIDESENVSTISLRDAEENAELEEVSFDTSPPTEKGWTVEVRPLEEQR